MGKCPQPVTDSSQKPDSTDSTDSVDTTGLTIRQGYSFRVIAVDDKPTIHTTVVPKPEVTMKQNPSEKITPITTKKPVKL
jgi:hypothetical protein